jgi:protein-tyrosine phosphatase
MSEEQPTEREMLEVLVPLRPEASLRLKMAATRDRLIDAAASRIIKMGKASPRLRNAGLWLYGTATFYVPRGKDVQKLGDVGANVLRGAQPSLRAFATLHDLGVNTIINLRPESDHERSMVERLGMKYLYLPLPPLGAPTHEQTRAFLEATTDPDNGTVFFHCFHGVDRTGTMAACLRIARDNWTVEAALEEMRAYKVHESGQRAKLEYLSEFEAYWQALPLGERLRTLHRTIPGSIEPAPPRKWWERLRDGVKAGLATLRGSGEEPPS